MFMLGRILSGPLYLNSPHISFSRKTCQVSKSGSSVFFQIIKSIEYHKTSFPSKFKTHSKDRKNINKLLLKDKRRSTIHSSWTKTASNVVDGSHPHINHLQKTLGLNYTVLIYTYHSIIVVVFFFFTLWQKLYRLRFEIDRGKILQFC